MSVEKKKAILQQKIHCYKQRGKTNATSPMLQSWRNSLRIIQKGQDKATELGKLVHEFTGQSVCSDTLIKLRNHDFKNDIVKTSLGIFYKFGIENNIPKRFLAWYTGQDDSVIPYRTRKKFTQSFTIQKNLNNWREFQKFINEKNEQEESK